MLEHLQTLELGATKHGFQLIVFEMHLAPWQASQRFSDARDAAFGNDDISDAAGGAARQCINAIAKAAVSSLD